MTSIVCPISFKGRGKLHFLAWQDHNATILVEVRRLPYDFTPRACWRMRCNNTIKTSQG